MLGSKFKELDTTKFDAAKLEAGARLILDGLHLDTDVPNLRDTPARVARMYAEMCAGLDDDPASAIDVFFDESYDEIVLVRDIAFASLCEHHLLPFIGVAHVGYLPNEGGQVTGLSKLARAVEIAARRPGLQERMTNLIADSMVKALSPRGVVTIVEAEHACMTVRGVRKRGSATITSAVRGTIRTDPRTRSEVMALLRRHG
jgi:GTP cyclohydrolase I